MFDVQMLVEALLNMVLISSCFIKFFS
jgi:hypothetical protein